MVALRDEHEHKRPGRPRLRVIEPAALPLVRKDTLPEYADYRDTGCELSPSCLACPLPRCQYDEPGGVRRRLAETRDREIVRLRREGTTIAALARRYRITKRTVYRVLKARR